jgi:hypothetical protein
MEFISSAIGIKPKSFFEFIGNIFAESPLLKVESQKMYQF